MKTTKKKKVLKKKKFPARREKKFKRPDHKDGWLDRDGHLHKCKFNHHARAEVLLYKKFKLKYMPEYLGWVKVHGAGVYFYWERRNAKITQAQRRWLTRHGYDLLSMD